MRQDISAFDEALEQLELLGEADGLARLLPDIESRWTKHYASELRDLSTLDDANLFAIGRNIRHDQELLLTALGQMRELIGRATMGDASASDQLWVTGHVVRQMLACHVLRDRPECTVTRARVA